jgi:hypothetical protein
VNLSTAYFRSETVGLRASFENWLVLERVMVVLVCHVLTLQSIDRTGGDLQFHLRGSGF